MKEKSKLWIVIAILLVLLLVGYWVMSSPKVEQKVDQQSETVIKDLTLD